MNKFFSLFLGILVSLTVVGCGKRAFIKGEYDSDVNRENLMDDKWSETDMQKVVSTLVASAVKHRAIANARKPPVVMVTRLQNKTSEHIDSQLETLLADFETALINSGTVTVISRERQRMLIEELKQQRSAAFNPQEAAKLGKQLGAQYFITGKITSSSEKSGTEKRVQYFLFMQAIEIATGAIRWQKKATLTKGLIN